MRLFILFLFLIFSFSVPALADGKKSFDTSMVPKKGSAPARPPSQPPQQPAAQPPRQPAAQAPTQPRRPAPPAAQDTQEPQVEEPSSLLEQVLNERNSSKNHGSGMQSRTIGIPDDLKEKRTSSKNAHDDGEFLDEPEEKQEASRKEGKQEESQSAEESIWDRYKAMANGADNNSSMKSNVNMTGNKSEIDTPETEELSEREREKEKAAEEYEEKKAQASVLGRALSDYRNNKKAKKINKRSYGSLND